MGNLKDRAYKFAILALTDPSDHPRIFHAFLYLFNLRDSGVDAELFLDGAAVKIIEDLEKNPNDVIKPLYDRAVKEGLIKQVCHSCASAFQVRDKLAKSNIPLSSENSHINISSLVKENYQLLIV